METTQHTAKLAGMNWLENDSMILEVLTISEDEWLAGDGFIMRHKKEKTSKREAPTKEEQVKAILSGLTATYEPVTETLGVKHMARHCYAEVFTVTRKKLTNTSRNMVYRKCGATSQIIFGAKAWSSGNRMESGIFIG